MLWCTCCWKHSKYAETHLCIAHQPTPSPAAVVAALPVPQEAAAPSGWLGHSMVCSHFAYSWPLHVALQNPAPCILRLAGSRASAVVAAVQATQHASFVASLLAATEVLNGISCHAVDTAGRALLVCRKAVTCHTVCLSCSAATAPRAEEDIISMSVLGSGSAVGDARAGQGPGQFNHRVHCRSNPHRSQPYSIDTAQLTASMFLSSS